MIRISNHGSERLLDTLAIESPLSIELTHRGVNYPLGITMRTPGEDLDLTVGFLYSEGVIEQYNDINNLFEAEDEISVELSEHLEFDVDTLRRQTLTSSACGVCGKVSLTNLHQIHTKTLKESCRIKSSQISENLKKLHFIQPLFEMTGGVHAAVAFDHSGNVIASREDVGRHNALDKLIGHMLRNGTLDTEDTILHVSGRSSFELVQKTIRAGFPIMASVGAASSLAVELAREYNLTLVCFLKPESMVVHSAPNRIT